jgi:putative phosphoesterase
MSNLRIGLISDTHGLLRSEALTALDGVDRIIHAGDIGAGAILDRLGQIAPVIAVRGNNDRDAWAAAIPEMQTVEAGGIRVHVLHDVKKLDSAAAHGAAVVVSGHSHKPSVSVRDGVLFVNPGSAGPRRFRLPVSVALLEIGSGVPSARIVTLDI